MIFISHLIDKNRKKSKNQKMSDVMYCDLDAEILEEILREEKECNYNWDNNLIPKLNENINKLNKDSNNNLAKSDKSIDQECNNYHSDNDNDNDDEKTNVNKYGLPAIFDVYKLVPSPEQQEIINIFKKLDTNIKITAAPGSGKTTTFLFCSAILMMMAGSTTKKCLCITYNKRLQISMEKVIKKFGIQNLDVKTYHAACGKVYDQTINDDIKLIDVLKKEPTNIAALDCDVLMLDETQDMTIAYNVFFEKVKNLLPRHEIIVVVGDARQAINQYNGSRVEFLTNCDKLPSFDNGKKWVSKNLSVSYRLTPSMANFINRHILNLRPNNQNQNNIYTQSKIDSFFKKYEYESQSDSKQQLISTISKDEITPIVGGNTRDPDLKPFYHVSSFNTLAKDIAATLMACISKYGCENVAILVVSTKPFREPGSKHPLAQLNREYLRDIPTFCAQDGEVLNAEAVRGKLIVASWASMKGCEKAATIVMGFDESYFQFFDTKHKDMDRLPEVLLVAASRAIKETHFFADHNKTFRTIDVESLAKDATIISTISAGMGRFMQPKPFVITTRQEPMRTTDYTIKELLRHIDSDILYQLNSMLDITAGPVERQHKAANPHDLSSHRHYAPLDLTPALPEDFSFFVKFDTYSENTISLYLYVIMALVEREKNGAEAKFASKSYLPQVVDNFELTPQQKQSVYALTRRAYNDFPKGFWDQVKSGYLKKPQERKMEDWFRLAVAEIVFTENNHHTARQIKDYKWVDKNVEFVNTAKDSINYVMKPNTGDFMKNVSKTIDKYHIRGTADFIDTVKNEVWQFECVTTWTPDYMLQLACLMVLSGKPRGYFYCILSGKIYSLQFKDDSVNSNINNNVSPLSFEELGNKFISTVLTKFDKKVLGVLLNDIQAWKEKHLKLSPIVEKKPEIKEPEKKLEPEVEVAPKYKSFLNLKKK